MSPRRRSSRSSRRTTSAFHTSNTTTHVTVLEQRDSDYYRPSMSHIVATCHPHPGSELLVLRSATKRLNSRNSGKNYGDSFVCWVLPHPLEPASQLSVGTTTRKSVPKRSFAFTLTAGPLNCNKAVVLSDNIFVSNG